MRRTLLVLLALSVVGAPATSPAPADTLGQEVPYGAGSVFGTLFSAPFKATFCIFGAVSSGLVLPFSGPQGSGRMVIAACAGTSAITPDVLKGQPPVRFGGDQRRASSEPQSTTSEPRSTIKDWHEVDEKSPSAAPR